MCVHPMRRFIPQGTLAAADQRNLGCLFRQRDRTSAPSIRNIAYKWSRRRSWQAGLSCCAGTRQLAAGEPFRGEGARRRGSLKSFEDLRPERRFAPLVFLTTTDYHSLRSLLRTLKPASPDVVIYYANRLAPQEAAQLGKLVGETRPNHTSVLFEAKAAAASVLSHSRSSGPRSGKVSSANRTRQLREHFGLTQTELAHSLGVSLRTVQNWERAGVARSARQLRDLEELWTILKDSIQDSDIPEFGCDPKAMPSQRTASDRTSGRGDKPGGYYYRRVSVAFQAGEPA